MSTNSAMASTTTLNPTSDSGFEKKFGDMSFRDKLIFIKNIITVEPLIFTYLLPSVLAGGALLSLEIGMACHVNEGLNDTICSNFSQAGKHYQVVNSNITAWKRPLSTAIPAILVLFFGAYSDRYKVRKPFFILPVIGEIFSGIGLTACVPYRTVWPMEVASVMSSIVPACFGGVQTIMMAIYSYISDISTKEMRTTRIAIVEICSIILTPLGRFVSGILYFSIGYYGVFLLCIASLIFSLLYGIFWVKETSSKSIEKRRNVCVDLFDPRQVFIDMFRILAKKREGHRRIILILIFVVFILIRGPVGDESEYMYQYIVGKFAWTVDYIGYFGAYDLILSIIGSLIMVAVFSKKLQWNDLMIVIMACCIKIVAGFWYAFTGNSSILFILGTLLSMYSSVYIIAIRSYATKIVDENEIAKAQALFGICEAIAPIIYSPIFNKFFLATHEKFLGAFFLLASGLIVPAVVILIFMYIMQKKDIIAEEAAKAEEQSKYPNTIQMTHM